MQRKSDFNFGANGIWSLIMLIVAFVALWFIASSVFKILAWAAPVLLIGALLVNYQTVLGYGRFVLNLFKRNWLTGIVAILLTIFGFPVVSGFLFAKSFLDRKVKTIVKDQERKVEGEFVEFEEVIEEEPEVLDLPPMEKAKQRNEYDDLFSDSST
jgi:small-conductance mechanosensitive channel